MPPRMMSMSSHNVPYRIATAAVVVVVLTILLLSQHSNATAAASTSVGEEEAVGSRESSVAVVVVPVAVATVGGTCCSASATCTGGNGRLSTCAVVQAADKCGEEPAPSGCVPEEKEEEEAPICKQELDNTAAAVVVALDSWTIAALASTLASTLAPAPLPEGRTLFGACIPKFKPPELLSSIQMPLVTSASTTVVVPLSVVFGRAPEAASERREG
mmetsp:Transcript_18726/g.31380  ORF Transcript_18726/g.31380 Transcript_18726/m.31380 type:complete len:216 (-) Transcript_18726:468-1115(-)